MFVTAGLEKRFPRVDDARAAWKTNSLKAAAPVEKLASIFWLERVWNTMNKNILKPKNFSKDLKINKIYQNYCHENYWMGHFLFQFLSSTFHDELHSTTWLKQPPLNLFKGNFLGFKMSPLSIPTHRYQKYQTSTTWCKRSDKGKARFWFKTKIVRWVLLL